MKLPLKDDVFEKLKEYQKETGKSIEDICNEMNNELYSHFYHRLESIERSRTCKHEGKPVYDHGYHCNNCGKYLGSDLDEIRGHEHVICKSCDHRDCELKRGGVTMICDLPVQGDKEIVFWRFGEIVAEKKNCPLERD